MRKGIGALVLATAVAGAMTFSPGEARAQTTMPSSGRMTATPQGLVGTALLGAEAVILIEGLAGVRNRWVLIGTGAAGLVAGVAPFGGRSMPTPAPHDAPAALWFGPAILGGRFARGAEHFEALDEGGAKLRKLRVVHPSDSERCAGIALRS